MKADVKTVISGQKKKLSKDDSKDQVRKKVINLR